MSWTRVRVTGSLWGAAAITLALAAPGNAEASTLSAQNPGVGASSMVSCGIRYPTKDFGRRVSFSATPVTLRSGPSDSCTQTGQGTRDQRAQYLCYSVGEGGTWTFLRNVSTGDEGWVRDDRLPSAGSWVPCEAG